MDAVQLPSLPSTVGDFIAAGTLSGNGSNEILEELKKNLKEWYGYSLSRLRDRGEDVSNCLVELLIEGFDGEQLWSQTETLSRILCRLEKQCLSKVPTDFQLVNEEVQQAIGQLIEPLNESTKEMEDEQEEENIDEKKNDVDEFLNFDEMRAFVDEAEEEEEMENEDLLGSQAEESEEEDLVDDKPGNEIMYDDFFLPSSNKHESKAQVVDKGLPSRMEKERELLKEKIESLEEEAIGEKEWPFRGEIKAVDRPLNSALEVDLDYDSNIRPPPKPTQAHLDSIEALIKQRISERRFDDVELVIPPPIEETKKVLELDDTKAKQGLGEMYEEEYVKKTWGEGTLEEKEEKLRQEARRLFREASLYVDALSHFHFAPRPVVEDLKIKSNAPAVVMEDPLPVAVNTTYTLKTPAEVYQPKHKTGELVDDKELTKEERKRLRAKRKRVFKTQEKTESKNRTAKKISARQSLVSRQEEAGAKRRRLLEKELGNSTKQNTGSGVFRRLQKLQEGPSSAKKRTGRELVSTAVKL